MDKINPKTNFNFGEQKNKHTFDEFKSEITEKLLIE